MQVAPHVIDFFLRNMIYDGWHTHPGYYIKYDRIEQVGHHLISLGYLERMHFMKNSDAKGEYITIVVGLEEDDYSQFTIVYGYPI